MNSDFALEVWAEIFNLLLSAGGTAAMNVSTIFFLSCSASANDSVTGQTPSKECCAYVLSQNLSKL